ncbi:aryl-sulfate sulfotransferase [Virgibacillus sp. FSP13]
MQRKSLIKMLGLLMLVLAVLTACTAGGDEEKNKQEEAEEKVFDPEPNPDATQISTYDEDRIKEQEKIDQKLLAEYEKGSYSFDDPFIKLDPYNVAPLTALLKFETDKPMEIEVIVGSGNGQTPIEKKWKGYETDHEIPVLGLYPDTNNTVVLKAQDKDGNTKTTELSIKTEALPDGLPTTELVKANPEAMEDGLTFVVPSKNYLYAVDENADIRWYTDMEFRTIFTRLDNGNILINTKESEQEQYPELLEMDLLGKISNGYKIHIDGYEKDNLLHHDVIELPNGNWLATTHEPDSKYTEDHMHVIDRETGETVQEIDLKDIFPKEAYEEYDGEYAEDHDWFHLNAIWFDETDNSILISGRHQDTVMKLSYPDAKIKWILAAHEEWPKDYEQYLLDPENEDMKFPGGQHAVKTLPDMDRDDDTLDILLFDNNHVVTRGDREASDKYSHAVQYRINEKEHTISEVWEYGKDRGESFFSAIVGNTQYLPDTGNRLITSGYIAPEEDSDARISKVVETNDKDDADVVFEITVSDFTEFSGKQAYRAVRMPLYPEQDWEFGLKE